MVKFYVLTSGHFTALLRHNSPKYSNIPKEDTIIVINSLDQDYIKKAEKYCKDVGIEYYITESNGTPAKGKNSVLDLFLASDNDYCVMIDGDDFLTQHGVEYYKSVENKKIVPDALCLKDGLIIKTIDGKDKLFTIKKETHYVSVEELYRRYSLIEGIEHEQALELANSMSKLVDTQKYLELNQTFNRVTWLSKKAAQFRFDEDVVISEDTLHFLTLKDQAIKNKLKVYTLYENPATYIYDNRNESTVFKYSKNETDLSWVHVFKNKLDIMEKESKLHLNVYLKEYRFI